MRPENLAVELGISYNTVRNWEMGRTTPTIGFASRLATALNVELLWLIEGDREEVVA
jgi:transcriptional regulator with XRE-family HTH domain